MAKYPAPGRVKTRLAAALGEATACELYRAFVLDLADRLDALSQPVTWAYWPPDAPFAALLPGARCQPQRGEDLGERMAAAVARTLADGADAAIVIGADVPHVAAEAIGEAADALAADADLVLGPARDGGYYLLGVRTVVPALFAGIAWGTSTVLATTRARADAARLRTHLLAPGFDVDDAADLPPLRALLAAGTVRLPRTAGLLDATDRGSPRRSS